MGKTKTIIEALLIFMLGVLFSYYTYPFFNGLLSAFDTYDQTSGALLEGWGTISGLIWVGYFAILVLWILVWPAYLIFMQGSDEQQ